MCYFELLNVVTYTAEAKRLLSVVTRGLNVFESVTGVTATGRRVTVAYGNFRARAARYVSYLYEYSSKQARLDMVLTVEKLLQPAQPA